jgi:hypothetical protein
MSLREIGQAIELSPRTIEHRIERMRARAGVDADKNGRMVLLINIMATAVARFSGGLTRSGK